MNCTCKVSDSRVSLSEQALESQFTLQQSIQKCKNSFVSAGVSGKSVPTSLKYYTILFCSNFLYVISMYMTISTKNRWHFYIKYSCLMQLKCFYLAWNRWSFLAIRNVWVTLDLYRRGVLNSLGIQFFISYSPSCQSDMWSGYEV